MPSETCQRVGDYEVLSLLGAGGMGRVNRVRNIISDRVEAMKIPLDYASEPELAACFAALDHPNIAQLRTAFQLGNQLVVPVPTAQPHPAMDVLQPATMPEQAPHKPPVHATTQMAAAEISSGQPGAQQAVPIAMPPAPAGPSPREIQKGPDRLGDLGARADAARNTLESFLGM